MVGALLARGLLAGLVAGALAAAVAFAVAEPQVERALAFETATEGRGGPDEPEPVSRGVQRTAGLATGVVATSVALGGLLALAFAWAYGRLGRLDARATAALLAAGAFVTVTLVPFAKYPANPPAVGDPATIRERTLLYLTMVAISLASAWFAVRVRRSAAARLDSRGAFAVAVAAFLALVAAAAATLPVAPAAPPGFPEDVLLRFRVASVATAATMWAALGLVFGIAAERLLAGRARGRPT